VESSARRITLSLARRPSAKPCATSIAQSRWWSASVQRRRSGGEHLNGADASLAVREAVDEQAQHFAHPIDHVLATVERTIGGVQRAVDARPLEEDAAEDELRDTAAGQPRASTTSGASAVHPARHGNQCPKPALV
jgi:hypothetical protein